jgi:sortase A
MIFRILLKSLLMLLGAYLILTGFLGLFRPAPASGPGSFEYFFPQPTEVATGQQPDSEPGIVGIPAAEPSLSETLPVDIPTRLEIPAIQLDAPIAPAIARSTTISGQELRVWDVPEGFVAGWHADSAGLGAEGNVVLNGHHNIYGQVFARLVDLQAGDRITVYTNDRAFNYTVSERNLLPEKNQPLDVRIANSSWIQPTSTSRLTLVTCWPYETNTHRLIVVAVPEG